MGVNDEGADLAMSPKQPMRCSKPLSRKQGRLSFAASSAPVTADFTNLACKRSEIPLRPDACNIYTACSTCRTKDLRHLGYGFLAAGPASKRRVRSKHSPAGEQRGTDHPSFPLSISEV